MLPRLYEVGENRLNPVDMFMNLRRAIADGVDFDVPMQLTSGVGTLVPQKYVNTSYDWAKDWVIFPVDLDASNIVRLALLQAWTLKPALF